MRLAIAGLKPRRLELEITESVFMGDAATTDAMFAKLKKIGVRLALDDFGTGYSSLGYLRKAPFDKIKIDQSFVRGSTEDDNSNSAIIAAIVSLADALDMETTAEGVEAMDELALVKKRGATLIQGFIFSRAVPQEEVLEKLADGNFVYEPNGPEKQRSQRRTLFRRIGVIHEDHRYEAVLRNLSRTGAMIEGLLEVPVGTDLVLDLGGGQLAICRGAPLAGCHAGRRVRNPADQRRGRRLVHAPPHLALRTRRRRHAARGAAAGPLRDARPARGEVDGQPALHAGRRLASGASRAA